MSSITDTVSLTDWVERLLQQRDFRLMGHAQRRDDANLGLGWLYYALARVVRTTTAVVIGSYRGFVPLTIARALADNSEGGQVHFIDPSLADDFWKNESAVREHFANNGCSNIVHHLQTTQQFVKSAAYQQLSEIGILFIDGFHSAEQARFDFEAFAPKLSPQGIILLHDSVWRLRSRIYGEDRAYVHSVVDYVAELKRQPEWQLLDLPFGDGVTIVRRSHVPELPLRLQKPSP